MMSEKPKLENLIFKFRWPSLRAKIIAWSFVPTAIIMASVALVSFFAYQEVTEALVIERNRELARLSASQLVVPLTESVDRLEAETRRIGIYGGNSTAQRASLAQASNRLIVFDGGVIILDTFGAVVAAEPPRPSIIGQDWSDRAYFRQMLRVPKPLFSDIVTDGPEDAEVIVVAVPIIGTQGEFLGTLAGMYRLGATAVSAFYGDIVKLRIAASGTAYLVDGHGRVIYHSDATYIGEDFTAQEAVNQVIGGGVGAIRTDDLAGQGIVASFAPVPGTPWGLVTQESWAMLLKPSQGYRLGLVLLLLLGVVVPVVVVAIGVRRITHPINELIDAAQQVAGGNFGQKIITHTGDEIESLAEQFNQMSSKLQVSYTQLEQMVTERTNELTALSAIAAVVSHSLELEEILRDALNKAIEVTRIDAGIMYLLNEKEQVLNVATYKGFSQAVVSDVDQLKVGEGFAGRVAQTSQAMVVQDVSTDPRLTRLAVRQDGLRSLACVPLRAKGRVLGVFSAATYGVREFTDNEIQLLTSIGDQIGVAIENARLFEQSQQVAILEERQRLARDLHDSVTQGLYSVTLYAEAAIRLLKVDQTETVAEHLVELRDTAKEAMGELRLLVFELRPFPLEEKGLKAALEARLEAVEGRSGLKTSLDIVGECQLASNVEAALYRIAQEALNNALKHANAQNIGVTLCEDQHGVTLEITDDGVGFGADVTQGKGGMGLPGMRERVAQLGGNLTVDSHLGSGTRISVEISP